MYYEFEKLLKQKNITIYQVSKATGIPESTLYMWKRRSRLNPKAALRIETMQKIAAALHVSFDDLMAG